MKSLLHPVERIPVWLQIVLLVSPFAIGVVCVTLGRYEISVLQVLQAFWDKLVGNEIDATINAVIFNIRLPRIILALILGGGLACAGAAFQSLFGNPLATPDTLGVTSGASVGAIVALLLNLDSFTVQMVSLLFGIGTVALTTTIARRRGQTSIVMLVLAGVIVSALLSAVVSILKYTADPLSKLPVITYWLMGSLAGADYKSLLLGTPLILLGILILCSLRWRLNILTLSEDEAKASGIKVQKTRMIVILASTMITASCVSMCGQVGWVGLLIPHVSRMLIGSNNRFVMPVCLSLGAIFMLLVDSLARTAMSSEIPISVLTALIGAPIFISLLRKTGDGR